MDNRTYLKVKIKSLAEEARIIRKEYHKQRNQVTKLGLYKHRIGIVRSEARASLIAYGFLRGLPYKAVEPGVKIKPDWNRVAKLVDKFGVRWLTSMDIPNNLCGYGDPNPYSLDEYQELKQKQKELFEKWKEETL